MVRQFVLSAVQLKRTDCTESTANQHDSVQVWATGTALKTEPAGTRLHQFGKHIHESAGIRRSEKACSAGSSDRRRDVSGRLGSQPFITLPRGLDTLQLTAMFGPANLCRGDIERAA